jgi:hypothetical protein
VSPQLVGILAAIAASQARVAGMTAENSAYTVQGQIPLHGEQAFLAEAANLDALSIEARNCLQ